MALRQERLKHDGGMMITPKKGAACSKLPLLIDVTVILFETPAELICRGFLDRIDYKEVNRSPLLFQFETELFLDRAEYGRSI